METRIPSILFVEDDESIRIAGSRILTRFTDKLLVAEDGQEGLDLCLAHRPLVVITDLDMPRMHGTEMVRRIRESCDPVPYVIVITAYKEKYDLEGLADVELSKPVSRTDLVRELETYLKSGSR